MTELDRLRIRQLDQALEPFRLLERRSPPRDGWVRVIREALGMSIRQLAERCGLSKTSVHSIETNEAAGRVQLDSLRTVAEAMECDLVYALVPRGSLQKIIDRQAERKARELVDQVSDSMELEAQGVDAAERTNQLEALASEILRDRGRDFWDA